MGISPNTRCLFFDVFGTCVDWRKTVTETLSKNAQEALASSTSSVSERSRDVANSMTNEQWGELAQEWRNGYLQFVRGVANGSISGWKTVDEHHLESLHEILTKHGLISQRKDGSADTGSLWDEAQLKELNMVWHRLEPWPDTNQGLADLNRQFSTCTLSNGNVALLQDMVSNGQMPFTHVYSAEMFQSYKPNPKVYLGAAEKMGLKPEECALVAAHLDDLKAAKACGFGAVYIERPREERHPDLAKEDGVWDVWVREDEQGFITAAETLAAEVKR